MKNRNIRIAFFAVILSLTSVILYFFNEEKFYAEYWFQRKVEKYLINDSTINNDLATKILTFKFYDDSGIDIEIILNDIGDVSLGVGTWFKSNKIVKHKIFKGDKTKISKIINDFRLTYSKSESNSIDDHLSGRYSTLSFVEKMPFKNIEIAFYNIVPDEKYKKIKSEIIDCAEDIINNMEK